MYSTHLAVIDTDDASNHFRNDDHITEMGLDNGRFLIGRSFLLGLAQLLDETHRAALEATLEPAAGTGMDKLLRRMRLEGEGLIYEAYFNKLQTTSGENTLYDYDRYMDGPPRCSDPTACRARYHGRKRYGRSSSS